MSNSKAIAPEHKTLLNTLSTFTREELIRFRDYALSSYLNKKGPLIEFLDVLLPLINEGKTPTAAQTVKLLLKTAKLGTATYRSLFADLTRLVNGFIQNERYKNKPELAVSDMLSAVNAKRLNKLFDINLSLAKKISSNASNKSASDYLSDFMLASEAEFHEQLVKAAKHKETATHLADRLDEFFIINKMRLYCASRHHKQGSEPSGDIRDIVDMASDKRFAQHAPVQIYLTIYHLGEENGDKYFDQLKKQLKSYQGKVADVIIRDATVFAINHCVQQVNKGKLNYLRDTYELYKTALDKKFLYDAGELSAWDYSNLLAMGMQLKDYKWSEKFIEVYKDRIPTAGKKMNVVTFNMAKMYFFAKRYKDVLQLLQGVKCDELMYVLGVNCLLIKTYYEMGYEEQLQHTLTTFRSLLKRRKNIEAKEKKGYLQFIEYSLELWQKKRSGKQALKTLKRSISENTGAAEHEWLMEKASGK